MIVVYEEQELTLADALEELALDEAADALEADLFGWQPEADYDLEGFEDDD